VVAGIDAAVSADDAFEVPHAATTGSVAITRSNPRVRPCQELGRLTWQEISVIRYLAQRSP
jgi:hypothetical protein